MFSPPVTAAIVLGAVIFSVYQYFKSPPNSHYQQQYRPQQYRHWSPPYQDQNCTICIGTENGRMMHLACGHGFHQPCLQKWLLTRSNCPVCRQSV